MSVAYTYTHFTKEDGKPIMKEVKGVLSIESEQILFEYKLYDPAGNVISTLNKYSVDVQFLNQVEFKKGFWSASLIIGTTQMVYLEPLPGSSQGKIELRIKRADKQQASDFARQLRVALTERKLREM